MNKTRRAQIQRIIDEIGCLQQDIEELQDEEQDYMDNMPENLQQSDRYYTAEEAVSNLSSAVDSIADAVSYLESAME